MSNEVNNRQTEMFQVGAVRGEKKEEFAIHVGGVRKKTEFADPFSFVPLNPTTFGCGNVVYSHTIVDRPRSVATLLHIQCKPSVLCWELNNVVPVCVGKACKNLLQSVSLFFCYALR